MRLTTKTLSLALTGLALTAASSRAQFGLGGAPETPAAPAPTSLSQVATTFTGWRAITQAMLQYRSYLGEVWPGDGSEASSAASEAAAARKFGIQRFYDGAAAAAESPEATLRWKAMVQALEVFAWPHILPAGAEEGADPSLPPILDSRPFAGDRSDRILKLVEFGDHMMADNRRRYLNIQRLGGHIDQRGEGRVTAISSVKLASRIRGDLLMLQSGRGDEPNFVNILAVRLELDGLVHGMGDPEGPAGAGNGALTRDAVEAYEGFRGRFQRFFAGAARVSWLVPDGRGYSTLPLIPFHLGELVAGLDAAPGQSD